MKISIISTVYNKGKFLRKHIDSLLEQDYEKIEFIFVNDGSTDNSLEILKEYQKIYPTIVIVDQENKGLGKSREVGFLKSTGDFIYFVDSDDTLYDKSSITRMMNIFKEHPELDFTISHMINSYDNKDEIDTIIYGDKVSTGIHKVEELTDKIFRFSVCCKIIRSSKMQEEDFVKCKNFEDCIFTYNVFSRCETFYYDTKPIYVVNRKNENNQRITANITMEGLKDKYNIIEKIKTNQKFQKSIEKLEIKSYFDDLHYALFLKWKGRKEMLAFINERFKNVIIKEEHLFSKHYEKMNKYRSIYQNIYLNTMIGSFKKFKSFVKRIIVHKK